MYILNFQSYRGSISNVTIIKASICFVRSAVHVPLFYRRCCYRWYCSHYDLGAGHKCCHQFLLTFWPLSSPKLWIQVTSLGHFGIGIFCWKLSQVGCYDVAKFRFVISRQLWINAPKISSISLKCFWGWIFHVLIGKPKMKLNSLHILGFALHKQS